MITDADLDRESPEDEPTLLAWELADRLVVRAAQREVSEIGLGLKAISELTYKVAANCPGSSEAVAKQLEAMAEYLRRNFA